MIRVRGSDRQDIRQLTGSPRRHSAARCRPSSRGCSCFERRTAPLSRRGDRRSPARGWYRPGIRRKSRKRRSRGVPRLRRTPRPLPRPVDHNCPGPRAAPQRRDTTGGTAARRVDDEMRACQQDHRDACSRERASEGPSEDRCETPAQPGRNVRAVHKQARKRSSGSRRTTTRYAAVLEAEHADRRVVEQSSPASNSSSRGNVSRIWVRPAVAPGGSCCASTCSSCRTIGTPRNGGVGRQ